MNSAELVVVKNGVSQSFCVEHALIAKAYEARIIGKMSGNVPFCEKCEHQKLKK